MTKEEGRSSDHLELARRVLEVEAEAVRELGERLGQSFVDAVELLFCCRGRVVTMGIGKSGIICQKVSATLSSTGTPSLFIHPAEAIHGDIGMLAKGDVVLAISNSGETEELIRLLDFVKRVEIPLISFVGKLDSTLARASDVAINVGIKTEACPLGLAPTASTTAALAMGDALAMALLEKRGFGAEDFAELHPGGKLGLKLRRVGDLMHTGEQIPLVHGATPMSDAIIEMSRKGFGVTSVVDETGALIGVISDGDLRRLMQREGEKALATLARDAMTPHPRTIARDELATKALAIMERNHITSLLIVDGENRVEGLLHLHDLWRTQLI